jgi:17beta-estradiol 17-dehydrogenase / very-long-chain 3-oxoacyl-CoA reductase
MLVPTPKAFVRAALRLRGATGTRASLSPYWSHAILDFFLEKLRLRGIWTRMSRGVNEDIRRRALRKLERERKKEWTFVRSLRVSFGGEYEAVEL